jgi:hypothetical protein
MSDTGERLSRAASRLGGRLADTLDAALDRGLLADGRAFLRAAAADAAAGEMPRDGDPLAQLATTLALDARARDLLLAAGLPEEHEGYASLLRGLHPRAEPWLPVGLAAQWLYPSAGERRALRALLETSDLVRCGVLRLAGDAPFFERSVQLAEGLWPVLQGLDVLPSRLQRLPVGTPASGLDEWLATPRVRAAVVALRERRHCNIVVEGDDAEGLAGRAQALAQHAGVPALALQLAASAEPEVALSAQAHVLARGAVALLRLTAGDPPSSPPSPRTLFDAHPGPLLLCGHAGLVRAAAPTLVVTAEPLSSAARRRMWSAVLPSLAADDAQMAAQMAARHRMDPARALQVAGDVALVAALEARAPEAADVAASLRSRAAVQGSGAALTLVRPRARWDDLVLPADRRTLLQEAVQRLAHQATVLDDWGFLGSRIGARGVRLLFAGPPGTGKTLAAEAMAASLGVDLMVVDLSRVVSKWLGETEKNLASVFDSAEHAQAVLFFDEADALFGRRTEVSDAHDRYANLETAYLLQRLERFDGLAILATNLRQNLDPAFLRRLEFAVDFEEPDCPCRHQLWQRHMPPKAPLEADVNLYEMAALYPVVGGFIRNAAVAAGFLAATDGARIGRQHLVRAVKREYEKAGRPFPGVPPGFNA